MNIKKVHLESMKNNKYYYVSMNIHENQNKSNKSIKNDWNKWKSKN